MDCCTACLPHAPMMLGTKRRRWGVQLILDLGIPAPPPVVWPAITLEERGAAVAALARLIARATGGETEESGDD